MSIEARNVSKFYGSQKALDDVSFTLSKGGITGFLGPNGAGKSTLMKIITSYLPADTGEVFVNGDKVTSEYTEIRKNIGYLPENNPLYADLYVIEYLEITAGFYRLKHIAKRVADVIQMAGLGTEKHKKIGALSKGYKQRVGLAQALIHNPQVLILDEPTSGLDPNQLEEIRELIHSIGNEKTVLLSSHIMQEVEAVCNRVIIIHKGRIVADGDLSSVKSGGLLRSQIVCAEFDKSVTEKNLLALEGVAGAIKSGNTWLLESEQGWDIRPAIFRFAVNNNLVLLTMHEKQQNLENVFHELTKTDSK